MRENNENNDLIVMSGVCLRRGGKDILSGIDWVMRRGENWAVVGSNGSGKTTLLQIAGGALFPSAGTVSILGARLGACDMFLLRRRVGWVGSALLSRLPRFETVREIVLSGLKATFGIVYGHSPDDAEKAERNIERVGMADRMNTPFGALSQGEQQKTLFARAMMADPELYIFDEACSGLDPAARESFLRVVDETIARRAAGVVMVSHHIEEIPRGVTHALALKAGRVLAAGAAEECISSAVLSEAFGIDVAVDRMDGRFTARIESRVFKSGGT